MQSFENPGEGIAGVRCAQSGLRHDDTQESAGDALTGLAAWAICDDDSILPPVVLDVGVSGQYVSAALAVNRSLTLVGTLDESAMVWQRGVSSARAGMARSICRL